MHREMLFCYTQGDSSCEGGTVMMTIQARDVANYFLQRDADDSHSDGISHLKMQKLVYYAYGFYYAIFQHKLFEEGLEARQHDPVEHNENAALLEACPDIYERMAEVESADFVGIPFEKVVEDLGIVI